MPGAEIGLAWALLEMFAEMNWGVCLALTSGSLQALPAWVSLHGSPHPRQEMLLGRVFLGGGVGVTISLHVLLS